jgi:outer membrane protein TolC
MIRRSKRQNASGDTGCFLGKSGSKRRAMAYRVRCLMLATFCVTTFASTPQGFADPRPFVPPLASCHNYGVCPSRTAACIGLPYIQACDPAVNGGAAAGPAWNLTLQEAVNTAMANSEAVRNLGLVEAASKNDIVRSLITTYDPMEADALAAAEWGIFDPVFTVEALWDRQNIPPGTSFSGIGNRPPLLDTADNYASLEQLLPIGARVRADAVTNYLFNPANPVGLDPNPQYFSYHQVGITQPLLRGFGVDVTMAPIKIAAAEAERTDWRFKQEMLALVRSIETTYWSLYAQQQNLKAIERAIPHFQEVVRLREEQAKGAVGAESEIARAQSDYYLFEQRRLDTLSRIAEQQLVLRNLMGLPPDDCRDIVLLAVPVTTRPFETLQAAVDTAVNTRPDVLRQRLAVYVASQERLLADDALKPQLDLNGFYRVNGLGETLPDSYDSKFDNNFESWNMGFFFQIPLGRRQGRAELRAAELRVARERTMLNQTAHQASYEVADAYRRINWVYQQMQVAGSRQQALNQWSQGAKAQFESPPPGMTTVFALELYLQNLRDNTDAAISANALIADYNSALARLEEVKGTLLENRMIEVAGDTSDSMPAQLPAPEIQMPESVTPAPQPAPQPAAPQAAPQGAMVAPTAEAPVEIAREPQVLPQPAIVMPESIQAGPNAYADLPVTPAPQPMVEPTPEPIVEAPIEIAEQSPPIAVEPLPAIQPTPAIEMPSSVLPEPAYTAMRPAPIEAPMIEQPLEAAPLAAEPVFEEPMVEQPFAVQPYAAEPLVEAPVAEAPVYEAPIDEEPPVAAPAPEYAYEAPQLDTPPQPAPSLAMPESILPTPAPALEITPQPQLADPRPAKIALSQPESQPIEVAARPTNSTPEPLPQAALRMPASLKPAPKSILVGRKPQQRAAEPLPTPAPAQMPSASLQLPNSIQSQPSPAPQHLPAAPMEFSNGNGYVPAQPLSVMNAPAVRPPLYAAETRSRQTARPLPAAPSAAKPAPRGQAGPQLQMPSSVRPAAVETPIRQSPQMAFPGSVGAVNR